MAYNSHGKRIRSENLAGQVTTTAWDQFACTSVDELISAAKNAKSAKHAYDFDDIGNRKTSFGWGRVSNCKFHPLFLLLPTSSADAETLTKTRGEIYSC